MAFVMRKSALAEVTASTGALNSTGSVGFEPTDGGTSTVTGFTVRRDKPLRQLPKENKRVASMVWSPLFAILFAFRITILGYNTRIMAACQDKKLDSIISISYTYGVLEFQGLSV